MPPENPRLLHKWQRQLIPFVPLVPLRPRPPPPPGSLLAASRLLPSDTKTLIGGGGGTEEAESHWERRGRSSLFFFLFLLLLLLCLFLASETGGSVRGGDAGPAMEPFPKRFRPELDRPLSREEESPEAAAQLRLQDWVTPHLGSGRSGDHECRRFNTPEGCPYGSSCRFRHVPNGGRQTERLVLSFGGHTKPCMRFFSTSGCPYGDSCHFLHYLPGGLRSLGLAPVVPSAADAASQWKPVTPSGDLNFTFCYYKTRLCYWFNTPEGCRYGDCCHFAHGVDDLRPPSKVPRGNWGPMGHGPPGTTPPRFINGSPMNANGDFSSPISPAPHGSSPGPNFQGYGEPYIPGTPGTTAVSAATHRAGPVGGGPGGNAQVY